MSLARFYEERLLQLEALLHQLKDQIGNGIFSVPKGVQSVLMSKFVGIRA